MLFNLGFESDLPHSGHLLPTLLKSSSGVGTPKLSCPTDLNIKRILPHELHLYITGIRPPTRDYVD